MRTGWWHDWRARLALGVFFVLWGLFGLAGASDLTHKPTWLNYFLPAVMLVIGCVHLLAAWRRRQWSSFDR